LVEIDQQIVHVYIEMGSSKRRREGEGEAGTTERANRPTA
jgi:hypothetical protein